MSYLAVIMNQQWNLFTFRNQEGEELGGGARGTGVHWPHMACIQLSQSRLYHQPCLYQSDWPRRSLPLLTPRAGGGGRDTWGTMAADGCVTLGGHWCCLRTWTEGSCSSCRGNIWARMRGGLPGLERQRKSVLHFNSSSSHSQACPSKALMEGSSLGPCEFPWEWSLCPLLQKGEAVHWFHFLPLPQPGSRMTWPTDNLDAWKPKTSTLFFLCVYVPFLLAVEANKRRRFARIACLLGRLKKGKSDSRV